MPTFSCHGDNVTLLSRYAIGSITQTS